MEECEGACPTQATGTTADGRPFYFRYRFGSWTVTVFGGELYDWDHATVVASGDSDRDAWDGVMDEAEVRSILDASLL